MSEPQGFFPGNAQGMAGQPQYAGFWWRFLASFIDGLIVLGVKCLIGLGFALIYGVSLVSTGADETTQKVFELILNLTSSVVGLILGWLYFALMESSEWQATLGKKICNLKVTDTQGDRLTFGRATGRYFGKVVSSLTCCVGYIMAAFTEKKQALHDIIANTLVFKNQA